MHQASIPLLSQRDHLFLSYLFSTLRLVDVDDIKRRPEALELAVFQNIVMKHIEQARETLIKK